VQRIEQVVPADDQQSEQHQPRAWQPEQRREGEHAQADGPDHLEVDDLRRELEGPSEVDQGELERHQKQPALEQKARHRVAALMLFAIEER